MIEPIGDPAAIRAKAAELRAAARTIEDVVAAATSRARSMFFEGPRGDSIRHELGRARSGAERSFQVLIDIAARLEQVATTVEVDRAAFRRAMERREH